MILANQLIEWDVKVLAESSTKSSLLTFDKVLFL